MSSLLSRVAYHVGRVVFWAVAAAIVVGMLIGLAYLFKDLWQPALGLILVFTLYGCARYYAYERWGKNG